MRLRAEAAGLLCGFRSLAYLQVWLRLAAEEAIAHTHDVGMGGDGAYHVLFLFCGCDEMGARERAYGKKTR